MGVVPHRPPRVARPEQRDGRGAWKIPCSRPLFARYFGLGTVYYRAVGAKRTAVGESPFSEEDNRMSERLSYEGIAEIVDAMERAFLDQLDKEPNHGRK